jgi:hypothetical protein
MNTEISGRHVLDLKGGWELAIHTDGSWKLHDPDGGSKISGDSIRDALIYGWQDSKAKRAQLINELSPEEAGRAAVSIFGLRPRE